MTMSAKEKELDEVMDEYLDKIGPPFYPNSPSCDLNIQELIDLYKKCNATGKPWREYRQFHYKPDAEY